MPICKHCKWPRTAHTNPMTYVSPAARIKKGGAKRTLFYCVLQAPSGFAEKRESKAKASPAVAEEATQ